MEDDRTMTAELDRKLEGLDSEVLDAVRQLDAMICRVINQLGPVEASRRIWAKCRTLGDTPASDHMATRMVCYWVDLCKAVGEFTLPPWAESDPDFGKLVLHHLLEESSPAKL